MNKVSTSLKNIWKDESAQGATEYILLLVVVVGLVFAFKGKIVKLIENLMGKAEGQIGSF